jgi:CHAT domain-containing protein
VRSLCPLPDTAYEIKCVAERFKDKAPLIRLEGEATEADLKNLSKSGKLARYRILHFATHGLLSGDVERMAKRQGEPALVLTPPDKPADADDDGLLTASEVAALKLNADWVVLSACNTAAGEKVGSEALSGLARAFFYAGARALLVSHWPVYSDAAVRLTTTAFAELERNPKLGRAETLRQSMIALMDDRSQADNAHPAVWAPFAVVGEGGR